MKNRETDLRNVQSESIKGTAELCSIGKADDRSMKENKEKLSA